ncbi:hypothetical protein [Amycolatopsis anabasis]|uniref:hypothetical protein n=1 Tax=Amycolatopsis anabasis TaxID=1840409 RepID=UPI00131C991C|nr:hypothetical protein [Amycolatopsis anabasis]
MGVVIGMAVAGCSNAPPPEGDPRDNGCFAGLEPAIREATGAHGGQAPREWAARRPLGAVGERLYCSVSFDPGEPSPMIAPGPAVQTDYCRYWRPVEFREPNPAAEDTCGFPTPQLPADHQQASDLPIGSPGIGQRSISWPDRATVNRGTSHPTGNVAFLHGQIAVLVRITFPPGAPDLVLAAERLARAVAGKLAKGGVPSPTATR